MAIFTFFHSNSVQMPSKINNSTFCWFPSEHSFLCRTLPAWLTYLPLEENQWSLSSRDALCVPSLVFPVRRFALEELGRHNKCGDPHVLNSKETLEIANCTYFLQAKAKRITVRESGEGPICHDVQSDIILNTSGSYSHYPTFAC